jgi:hypothetical protein
MVGADIITIILIIGTVDGNRGRETNPAGFDSAGLFFYLPHVVNSLYRRGGQPQKSVGKSPVSQAKVRA